MSLQKNLSDSMTAIHANRRQTLTAFAKELGISRSSLQEILKGNGNPRIDTIEQIASQLRIDPLELLASSEDQLKIMLPLSQFLDVICDLPDDKKQELLSAFNSIVGLFMNSDQQQN